MAPPLDSGDRELRRDGEHSHDFSFGAKESFECGLGLMDSANENDSTAITHHSFIIKGIRPKAYASRAGLRPQHPTTSRERRERLVEIRTGT